MSKKRILAITFAIVIILFLAKDIWPITIARDAVTPLFTNAYTIITDLYNSVGQNLMGLPIIGTLVGGAALAILKAFKSRMDGMRTGATQQIQDWRTHYDSVSRAKTQAEQELSKVQGELEGLKQEKTSVTEELLTLKTDLLDVRNEFSNQTKYVRQLETEKLEAQRNLTSVTTQLKQFLEEQKKVQ